MNRPPGDRSHLPTEGINPRTVDIDTRATKEIVALLHEEDRHAVRAVGEVLDEIAEAVERVEAAFRAGGRLLYVGAGSSGRLGVLDAAEVPPTFGTDPELVQGVIAGGHEALVRAREGAEDDAGAGAAAMEERDVGALDVVLGIAAGSTTPYVIGALGEARRRGATTIFFTCVPPEDTPLAADVDLVIAPPVGPEAIAGSTRLKAGTATKLALNAITTTAMVRLGKTFGNRMVDLRVHSDKLAERGRRILRELLEVDDDEAAALLDRAGGAVKTALVMGRKGVGREEAERRLDEVDGFLRRLWDGTP